MRGAARFRHLPGASRLQCPRPAKWTRPRRSSDEDRQRRPQGCRGVGAPGAERECCSTTGGRRPGTSWSTRLPGDGLRGEIHPGGRGPQRLRAWHGVGGSAGPAGRPGFRFFPSFYKHLPDTMKRIPFGTNPQGVFEQPGGRRSRGCSRPAAPGSTSSPTSRARSRTSRGSSRPAGTPGWRIPDADTREFLRRTMLFVTSCPRASSRRVGERDLLGLLRLQSAAPQLPSLLRRDCGSPWSRCALGSPAPAPP